MPKPDLTRPRHNPVVDLYVTTDLPLSLIFEQAPKTVDPVARALRRLDACLAGTGMAKEAIEAAGKAPLKGSDPELLVLMLGHWAELSCRMGRPSECEALLHRARALLNTETHPEIQTRILIVQSILDDIRGNKSGRESTLLKAIKELPEHSPRRKYHLLDYTSLLAQQGRSVDCQEELRELTCQCGEQLPIARLQVVQFVNAVETGDAHEAARLVPQIAGNPPRAADTGLPRHAFRDYQYLLRLMRNQPLVPRHGTPNADMPAWVAVADHLIASRKEDALRVARQEANRLMGSIFDAGFGSFNLVRAELASGKWESAKRLIEMRRGRGNSHYLDDFFLARAEFMADSRGAASGHFREVLTATERYRAKGRLDFELRLACELSHSDILMLTQSATRAPKRSRKARRAETEATAPPAARRGLDLLIGNSAAMSEIRDTIQRFADLNAPVLVTGETGTGKELVAKALHDISTRNAKPFIAVNCGSIAETLLESEMFGHERGAFTGADRTTKGLFEAAADGTIFLDEIGDITPRLQTALLRVLETSEIRPVGSNKTRTIKCRVVAATNADLNKLAERGRFRKDLLFRLQRLCIYVPPLRDRPRDIRTLARHFVDIDRRIGVHAFLSDTLVEALVTYDWPGNVRELRNVVERMRLLHSDKQSYDIADLDLKFREGPTTADAPPAPRVPADASAPGAAPPQPSSALAAPVSPRAVLTDGEVSQLLKGGRSPLRRRDRLRELFRSHGKLTRAEIVQILDVSPNTATGDLKALQKEGFIERVEPSKSTRSHYFQLAAS